MNRKRRPLRIGIFIFLVNAVLTGNPPSGFPADKIRAPAAAGQFYPENPDRLKAAVQRFLADAVPPTGVRPVALVSPHAGYIYSGQIMADAFAQARGHDYDLVVLLGANHTRAGYDGVAVFPGAGFRTPLGVAPVDTEAARRLMNRVPEATLDESLHRREHSIEVLVPFVQVLFPDIPLLPAIVSLGKDEACIRFGTHLADTLSDKTLLLVASSDLSHYPKYADACRADRHTLTAMACLDAHRFLRHLRNTASFGIPGLATRACGERPVTATLAAAKQLGATSGRIVSYANSGDSLVGNRDRVVGYGAAAFYRNPIKKVGDPFFKAPYGTSPAPLSPDQKKILLAFARKTLVQYFQTDTVPLPRFSDPRLYARQGAFVTLKRHGALRGCMGHIKDDLPLCRVVGRTALQAGFEDRRFPPLKEKELDAVEIEISVLTPYRRVDHPRDIVIGRDGVILKRSGRWAVFLPQVAPAQGWRREEMLAHLSRKAGLSETAWKEGADLYTFQAQVFGESAFPP
jgi:AmmeMemoRadiSam system protein B/AmmeMemoRadiSam system protein A